LRKSQRGRKSKAGLQAEIDSNLRHAEHRGVHYAIVSAQDG